MGYRFDAVSLRLCIPSVSLTLFTFQILTGISRRSVISLTQAQRFVNSELCSKTHITQLLSPYEIHILNERWLPQHFCTLDTQGSLLSEVVMITIWHIVESWLKIAPSSAQTIVDSLVSIWPTIFKWLRYSIQAAEDIHSAYDRRSASENAVAHCISVYTSTPALRPAVSKFPDLLPLAMRLSALELAEPRFYCMPKCTRSMINLNNSFEELGAVDPKSLDRLLSHEFGSQTVASIALAHLKRGVSRKYHRHLGFDETNGQ